MPEVVGIEKRHVVAAGTRQARVERGLAGLAAADVPLVEPEPPRPPGDDQLARSDFCMGRRNNRYRMMKTTGTIRYRRDVTITGACFSKKVGCSSSSMVPSNDIFSTVSWSPRVGLNPIAADS